MRRAGLTPERLVDDACALADEVGLDGVSMSALATRAGVKTASLYAHVRSLQDVRTRMAMQTLEELADRVADALAGRSGKDALTALTHAYRAYAVEHPGRYAATRLPLEPADARGSAGPRHVELTAAVLRGYGVPDGEHVHAIRLLGAAIHGYIDLQRSGVFDHSHPDADTSWSRAVDALDHLLTHWPGLEHAPREGHH